MTSIRDGLAPFYVPGAAFEVRILGTSKGTVSGYFDDVDVAASALRVVIRQFGGRSSLYVAMNPIRPACLARAVNRFLPFAKVTTTDADILRRRYLLIDVDPTRPKGISSTDEELRRALAKRDEVVAYLTARGWPMPILAMSGNGGHALYRVDLPNDNRSRELIRSCLFALANRFNDALVSVDTSVYNAARIVKLYGTFARKGDSTPERPHRLSTIDVQPDGPQTVAEEQLERLVRETRRSAPKASTTLRPGSQSGDLREEFERRGLYLRLLHGGMHAVVCPWREEHSGDSGDTETVIFEPRDIGGGWGFKCQHEHCAARTAGEVRAFFRDAQDERCEAGAQTPPNAGSISIRAAVAAFRRRSQADEANRLPFGIQRFDRATHGVEPGELVIQLGRTASGKSMYQQNHLRILAERRPNAAFLVVTMEMPLTQCLRRVLRQEYSHTDEHLDRAVRNDSIDFESFYQRYQYVHFLDQGTISLSAIQQHARDLIRQLGKIRLEAILIDHAGLIRSERPGSAYDRASETAIGLKQLARSLDLAVFCIVQANRTGSNHDGEPVNLEAARDSGCFEENADFVIAFGRLLESRGQTQVLRLRLVKNRRGPCVPAVLNFDPLTLRMTERSAEDVDGE